MDILDRLKEVAPEKVEEARRHLLTILHDEGVTVKDGLEGSENGWSPGLPVGWTATNWTDTAKEKAEKAFRHPASQGISFDPPSRDANRSFQGIQSAPADQEPVLEYHRRGHRRSVFKELCLTVYEIPNFRDVNRCLQDIVEGVCPNYFTHYHSEFNCIPSPGHVSPCRIRSSRRQRR
jgi:hypothetical protein